MEFDFDRLCQSDLEKQTYWVIAMRAARRAGSRQARSGARERRIRARRIRTISRRVRFGVPDVERQIRLDGLAGETEREQRLTESLRNQPTLISLSKRQTHPGSLVAC